MELSSRQIIGLGAPLVVAYLTWSTVGAQVKALQQVSGVTVSTSAAAKRPDIGVLPRNPFAPLDQAGALGAAITGEEAEGEGDPASQVLHLDGTVIAGKWRMAIISGQRVFEGQTLRGGLRLVEVETDGVTLQGPSGASMRLALDIAPAPAANAKNASAKKTSGDEKPERELTPLERGLAALKGELDATLAESAAEGAASAKKGDREEASR